VPAIGALQGRLPQMCACGEGLRMHAQGPPSANLTFAEGLGCQLGRAAVHKVNMCGRGGVAAGEGLLAARSKAACPPQILNLRKVDPERAIRKPSPAANPHPPEMLHLRPAARLHQLPSDLGRPVIRPFQPAVRPSSACSPTFQPPHGPCLTCNTTLASLSSDLVRLPSDLVRLPSDLTSLPLDRGRPMPGYQRRQPRA